MKKFHIGKLIKQKMEEKNLSAKELAKKIHCSRTNIYHILERPSIDMKLLIQISQALDYNFIKEIYIDEDPQRQPVQLSIQVIISNIQSTEEYNKFLGKIEEIQAIINAQERL